LFSRMVNLLLTGSSCEDVVVIDDAFSRRV
jgi:hypothetical protein